MFVTLLQVVEEMSVTGLINELKGKQRCAFVCEVTAF